MINFLKNRKENGIFRELKHQNVEKFIDFTHNSYLNLHKHFQVINKSIEYINKYGTSFTSSPLLGNGKLYEELENIILKTKKQESALIFVSGYQLNSTVIPAILANENDSLIFCDKEIHTSIHHGIKLSQNKQIRYKNCDLNHLEFFLKQYQNDKRQKFVFTESVFSMSGSVLNMDDFIFLKRKYGFFAYIDEAHSIGIFGNNGEGLTSKFAQEIEISMGTLSKAVASQGGYLVTNKLIGEYLINTCSGLIYSTGLAPSSIGASIASFTLFPSLKKEREIIFQNVQIIKNQLIGYNFGNSQSQIIQVIFQSIGDAEICLEYLKTQGILASLIRYPTFSRPMLRISVNCSTILNKH